MPRPRSPRRVGTLLLAAAVVPWLVGCDIVLGPESPRPSRLVSTPEPTPEATPDESDEFQTLPPDPGAGDPTLSDAADALADLDSYRFAITTRGLVPAATPSGAVQMTSTLIQGEHPAAQFTLTGVAGYAGGRLDAIVIGDEAWLREGSGSWHKSSGGAADFDAAFSAMSPTELLGEFEPLAGLLRPAGTERRNGQNAIHARAESTDPGVADAGLVDGSIDLWRVRTNGRLVAVDVDGVWIGDDGTSRRTVLRIDITRVNDPANRISAPG